MSHEELFEKYISATMSLEDKEELKELLKNDKEAGREFAEYIEDTATYLSLAEEMQLHKTAVDLNKNARSATANFKVHKATTQRTTQLTQAKSRTGTRVLLAIAAMFAVCGILFYNYLKTSKHVADIAQAESISLDRNGLDLSFGDKSYIMTGDKITALNDVKIKMKDGSQISMTKGASCQIVKTDLGLEVKQSSGRSEYNVAKQQGNNKFRVITDKSRTTVIGTQFTVDAEAERSKIRVTEGLVKVDDLKSVSTFVNPGEFAIVDTAQKLSKKVAYQTMILDDFITDAHGNNYDTESIEEKPFLILLYAENWDPASRSLVHKLKTHYNANNSDFEVILMNDKDSFAKDFDMPWACINNKDTQSVEEKIGNFRTSFPLNMILMDQHGNVLAKTVQGTEWLGADHVLDTLANNLKK